MLSFGYDRGKIYSSDKKREKLGYQESGERGQKRNRDIIAMEKTLRDGLKIHYIPAIKEFFAFQITDNGRMEAATGSHDDLVSAACRANFGFTQFKVGNQGIAVGSSKTWRG